MRRTFNNLISTLFSLVKFSIIKLLHWNEFFFFLVQRFSPNVVTEFNKGNKVKLDRMVRVHSGGKIKVRHGGKLKIGANALILRGTQIGDNCVVGAGSVDKGKYGVNLVIIQERAKNMRKIFGEYRRLTNFSLLEYLAVASDWRCAA